MNKNFLSLGFSLLVILIVSFFAFNAYIYNQKQVANPTEPYRATLEGEYVCLPHKVSNGPQTDECAPGIKTETGEHYAVDFSLMSQEHQSIQIGENFSANGLVTPIERLSSDQWQKYDVIGIFSVTDSLVIDREEQGSYVCQLDAKICPDGSAVGRQGPNCEFAACPSEGATSAEVTTFLGGTVTGLNVTVSPQEVVSDSRCPTEVTCIWAGMVEVRTVLSTAVTHGEHVLTLGSPQVFGEYMVELVGVSPDKTKENTTPSSYRFTFKISKQSN